MRIQRVGRGPLFPDDGSRAERLARRARGIAFEVAAFLLLTLLLPVAVLAALAVDLVLRLTRGRRWTTVRLVLAAWWSLLTEMRGMAALAGIHLVTGGPLWRGGSLRRRMVYGLRIHWCRSHLLGVLRLFGARIEVEGLDEAADGPMLVFSRHASILDNTLPDALLGRRNGIGLRVVLKREITAVPLIDIGARWVPTVFVRRGSGDTDAELRVLRRIAEGMGEDEAVLIFPEGTHHSPAKHARALEVIAERTPELSPLAGALRHVLPPRLGGPLALLDAAPGTDVVFLAHAGLDGMSYLREIWRGDLVGATIRVRLWRVPAAEIPRDRDERVRWLYEQWTRMDEWIGEHLGEPARLAAEPAAPAA